jgi:hypothetical protein
VAGRADPALGAREHLIHAQALAAYDRFAGTVTAEGHHAAAELLAGACDQVLSAYDPRSAPTWPTWADPNSAPGERQVRSLRIEEVDEDDGEKDVDAPADGRASNVGQDVGEPPGERHQASEGQERAGERGECDDEGDAEHGDEVR